MKRSLPWAAFTGLLIAAGGTTMAVVIITAMTTGTAPPIAAAAGAVLLWGGGTCLYSQEKPPPPDKEPRPVLAVDWFRSDVHAIVTCPCSPSDPFIIEGYRFGRYHCPHCRTPFQLPDRIEAHERRADTKRRTREKTR